MAELSADALLSLLRSSDPAQTQQGLELASSISGDCRYAADTLLLCRPLARATIPHDHPCDGIRVLSWRRRRRATRLYQDAERMIRVLLNPKPQDLREDQR